LIWLCDARDFPVRFFQKNAPDRADSLSFAALADRAGAKF